jgi:hypothetical protein
MSSWGMKGQGFLNVGFLDDIVSVAGDISI